jgi:hypothetical protein
VGELPLKETSVELVQAWNATPPMLMALLGIVTQASE